MSVENNNTDLEKISAASKLEDKKEIEKYKKTRNRRKK